MVFKTCFSLAMSVLETTELDENFTDIWTEMKNLILREVRCKYKSKKII